SMSQPPGQPSAASTMVGIVVTSSSSMMRGLVSAMYAPITSRTPVARAWVESGVTEGADTPPFYAGRPDARVTTAWGSPQDREWAATRWGGWARKKALLDCAT